MASLPRSRIALALLLFALTAPQLACGGAAYKEPANAASDGSGRSLEMAERAEVATASSPPSPSGAPRGRGYGVLAANAPSAPAGLAPAPPPPPAAAPASASGSAAAPAPGFTEARDPTLLIYEARFVLAVHLVETALASVERLAQENGGWVARKQDREIVVRVPRGRFKPVVEGVGQVGDVLTRDVTAVDVTDEHVDLEVRIKNAKAMQARLQELLARASVKDALEIEKELHRVTEELERMEGRMKLLTDKIAYSTITVTFSPRARTIEPGGAKLPFAWLGSLGLPSLLSLSEGSR